MASLEIIPMTPDHIDGYHRTLDFIARERRYLAFLEAPPLESTRAFVLDLIKRGCPQYVAVVEGEVVGWCDLTPKDRPVYAHAGVLGMGLLPPYRRTGRRYAIDGDGARRGARCRTASGRADGARDQHRRDRALQTMGFEVEGCFRDAVQVDGVYENVLGMARLF